MSALLESRETTREMIMDALMDLESSSLRFRGATRLQIAQQASVSIWRVRTEIHLLEFLGLVTCCGHLPGRTKRHDLWRMARTSASMN